MSVMNIEFESWKAGVGRRQRARRALAISDLRFKVSKAWNPRGTSRDKTAQLRDKMAQIRFALVEIKGNQGKSSPRAGNFFQKTL